MYKIIRTWNITRIIYNFKWSYVLDKVILIKSFSPGVLYDYFKLIYAYLYEGDKVHECCSCLKMMIQAYLDIVFFKIIFTKS